MLPMRAIISSFLADRRGATAIEYGLIVGVLSLAIVGGVGSVFNNLQNMFTDVATFVDDSYTP
jgi:pilus assembly protein Flp/PilA